jgi:hypothetical protein
VQGNTRGGTCARHVACVLRDLGMNQHQVEVGAVLPVVPVWWGWGWEAAGMACWQLEGCGTMLMLMREMVDAGA